MNQLTFENVAAGYGSEPVVRVGQGTVEEGTWVHLSGRNGAGKTTLLKVLAGLLKPLEGSVRWNGDPVRENLHTHRRRVRYFGHEVSLFERLSVSQNWQFYRDLFQLPNGPMPSIAEDVPTATSVSELSRGQKRRVELATVLASPRPLVLLDEPTSGLDPDSKRTLLTELESIASEGSILVTAAPEESDVADRGWRIRGGTLRVPV